MAKRLALPNGATVQIATGFAAPKAVTSISNAAPPVLESDAHGLTAGDYVMVESAWCEIDGRAFKVGVTDVDTVTLVGANTTSTTKYPTGGGVPANLLEVSGWTDMPCITDSSMTGGEAQFTEVACLQEDSPTNLPNGFSAATMSFTVSDDDGSAAIGIIEALSEEQERSVIRVVLRGGKEILYPGYVSITPAPTLTRGEVMTRTVSISISKITKYAAA